MKLLCLGDSLTEGYDIDRSKCWTKLLEQDLGIEIINCGISGDTTTGMLARCHALLLEHRPSHLLVLGGTNDLNFGLKDELIIANIHAMTRQARFLGIEFLVGIPTPSMNLAELNFVHENYSECIRSFCRALRRYCEAEETPYVDFSKGMQIEYFLADGIHPNEKGQVVMANTAKSVLKEFIR